MMPRLAAMMAPPRRDASQDASQDRLRIHPPSLVLPSYLDAPSASAARDRRARNLTAIRKAHGFATPGLLGRAANIPRGHIAYVESGCRTLTLRLVDALAPVLKMSSFELLRALDAE